MAGNGVAERIKTPYSGRSPPGVEQYEAAEELDTPDTGLARPGILPLPHRATLGTTTNCKARTAVKRRDGKAGAMVLAQGRALVEGV